MEVLVNWENIPWDDPGGEPRPGYRSKTCVRDGQKIRLPSSRKASSRMTGAWRATCSTSSPVSPSCGSGSGEKPSACGLASPAFSSLVRHTPTGPNPLRASASKSCSSSSPRAQLSR